MPQALNPALEDHFVIFHPPEDPHASDIVVVFNPSTPDRTEAIKGMAPTPIPFLFDSYRTLKMLGAEIVGIACNTMHYWYNRQQQEPGNPEYFALPTVHMIEETANALAARGITKAGLLATTGTVNTQLYQEAGTRCDISVLTCAQNPPAHSADLDGKGRVKAEVYRVYGVAKDGSIKEKDFQKLTPVLVKLLGEQEGLVMESIYGVWGIKAGYRAGTARRLMDEAAKRLVHCGAEALILG